MLPLTAQLNRISDYFEIPGFIGRGTFGIVRKGIHKPTGQFVSVKSNSRSVHKPILQEEAAIMSSMTHPNVMAALATFSVPERVFIIMPFASGGDLSAYLAVHTDPPERSVVICLVQQLSSAVAYAHSLSILHRDLKPANILLTAGEDFPLKVLLSDWNSATTM